MFTKSARFYDAVYAFKDYGAEAERVREVIEQRRRSRGDALLDVACGTGKHLASLSRHYAVEGLDLDPAMLEIARTRLPGVRFHQGDMTSFDLGRQFDAVICLFSSIGYAGTPERLRQALATFARHTAPGGVVVVEPWLAPEAFTPGHVHARFVDEADLKIARMNVSAVEGRVAVIEFHYLVGTPEGIEHFAERHDLTLFTHQEYVDAFRAEGLEVEHDPEGIAGRGLYVGARPAA